MELTTARQVMYHLQLGEYVGFDIKPKFKLFGNNENKDFGFFKMIKGDEISKEELEFKRRHEQSIDKNDIIMVIQRYNKDYETAIQEGEIELDHQNTIEKLVGLKYKFYLIKGMQLVVIDK